VTAEPGEEQDVPDQHEDAPVVAAEDLAAADLLADGDADNAGNDLDEDEFDDDLEDDDEDDDADEDDDEDDDAEAEDYEADDADAEEDDDAEDDDLPGDVAAEDAEADDGAADGEDGTSASRRPSQADLELESEIAADYIEGLLDVADLDGDIDMDVEGERAFVSVVGATLDELVGKRGEVLEALQELTRLAVHRQTGNRTRMMLDVGGYRQRRRAELAETGRDAADEVKRTGEPKRLWPMNPFERKVVHDAVAAAGLRSESEGEEPDRRVVVLPAG
jgi:spoIIIJ-associated protein